MPLTPVLTTRCGADQSWTLETYERLEGYQALRTALADGAGRDRRPWSRTPACAAAAAPASRPA